MNAQCMHQTIIHIHIDEIMNYENTSLLEYSSRSILFYEREEIDTSQRNKK